MNQSLNLFRLFRSCGFRPRSAIRLLSNCSASKSVSGLYMKPVERTETLKLDTPEFRKLFTPELNYIADLFRKYDYELRIAGGAVRDLLMGKEPHDVDFATTATPDQMKQLFEKENIRMLNKRGEKHGTITCRVLDKQNFEITTLRIDKLCDGRWAEVEFTTDWLRDANRRDLTVNSMFLGLDGKVYDFFGGSEDLKNRRITFVGDAGERIREDYLRILRYFRFFGRLANSPDDHDDKTIQAIKANVEGLKGISGERLWTEFKQIVVGRFAGPIVEKLFECGVLKHLGLPEYPNIAEFKRISEACKKYKPEPMTVISALLFDNANLSDLNFRLKMSNKENAVGSFIIRHRLTVPQPVENASNAQETEDFFKNLAIDLNSPLVKMSNAEFYMIELIKYAGHFDLLERLQNWQAPKFPINGEILMQHGVRKGPSVRFALAKLFDAWKKSGCVASVEDLVNQIDPSLRRDNFTASPDRIKQ